MWHKQPNTVTAAQLAEAKAFIDEQAGAGRDVSMAEIAAHADASPWQLFKAFAARYGVTLRDYLKRAMAKANLADRGADGLTCMEGQALLMAGLRLPVCPEVVAAHDRLILRGLGDPGMHRAARRGGDQPDGRRGDGAGAAAADLTASESTPGDRRACAGPGVGMGRRRGSRGETWERET